MEKYIENLEPYDKKYIDKKYNISYGNINCGDGYKTGKRHYIYSESEEDIEILINVIKRFKLARVCKIKPNSFEVYSTSYQVQIFFFRLCRYIRNNVLLNVLKETIRINDLGISIQNALLFAHYKNFFNKEGDGINKYQVYNGRDLINFLYNNGVNHSIFKNLKSFKDNLKFYVTNKIYPEYSNLFKHKILPSAKDPATLKKKVISLIYNDEFFEVEKLLIENSLCI